MGLVFPDIPPNSFKIPDILPQKAFFPAVGIKSASHIRALGTCLEAALHNSWSNFQAPGDPLGDPRGSQGIPGAPAHEEDMYVYIYI